MWNAVGPTNSVGDLEVTKRVAWLLRGERAGLLLKASGENIWGKADAFHFVYRKAAGDMALSADVEFAGEGKNAHRKAGLQHHLLRGVTFGTIKR